jgi:hypothetical protein
LQTTNNFSVSEDRDLDDMQRLIAEEERLNDYLSEELSTSNVLLVVDVNDYED